MLTVVLTTGPSYSEFLELCRQGKWEWFFPALVAREPGIMHALKDCFWQGYGASFG